MFVLKCLGWNDELEEIGVVDINAVRVCFELDGSC